MRKSGFRKQTIEEVKEKQALKRSVKAKIPSKKKVKPKTISKLKKELWQECRRIIANRYGKYCYTCDKYIEKGIHTGHFITSSTCSTPMRYSLDNLRPQCYHCNINLSGNWIEYERRLISEKGINFVSLLKIQNRDLKGGDYGISWYEAKIAEYKLI